MIFKLYDCDVGLTIRGTNYDFLHVENVNVEDPERNRLIRGANAGNKIGLAYKEGNKEAKTITIPVLGMTKDMHNLLKEVFASQERIDVYCVARSDGSSKMAKNAILCQSPKQLTVDETAESLNTSLMFESFDIDEIHKS